MTTRLAVHFAGVKRNLEKEKRDSMQPGDAGGAARQPVAGAGDGRSFDVHTYLRMLYRRRRLAAAGLLIPVLAALVYLVVATPTYRATARLWVDSRNPRVVTFAQVADGNPLGGQWFLPEQRDKLTSRSLAGAAIDRLGLRDHPALLGPGDSFFSKPIAVAGELVDRALSSLRTAVAQPPPSRPWPSAGVGPGLGAESPRESAAIDSLLRNLRVDADRNSRMVRLTFSARDPRLAADVANTLARLYIEQETELRKGTSRDASAWLHERIAAQRRQLEASEEALQRYREEHGAASIDYADDYASELAHLNQAVAEARRRRVMEEARYRDLEAARDQPGALERFPEILGDGFIREQLQNLARLRRERVRSAEDLGPRHPGMLRIESSMRDAEERLRSEIVAVVESARLAYQVARSQEEELLDEALALQRVGIGYEALSREVESRQRIYQSLLQRVSETSVTGEIEASHIRVLDAAQAPVRPASPRAQLLLLAGLLCGLFAAVGLVFVVELLDETIRTPEDVGEHLGIPFLGLIPEAAGRRAGWLAARWRRPPAAPDPTVLALSPRAPARFVESFRSLCTRLTLPGPVEGGRTLLVTSAAAGEGKSQVAANLAIAFARTGRRTLLVDLDLRRPHLHVVFAQAAAPGLSQLLAGETDDGGVVRPTAVPGLSLAAAGPAAPNAGELIGSGALTRFLASCRERFDRIVVDTVPVQPVADALAAASAVGGVLFVAAADSTSRRAAVDSLEQLAHSGASVVGCVLNKAEVERRPAFYYAPHYESACERYYGRDGVARALDGSSFPG